MATAEEVARELEILFQTLEEGNQQARRGLAFDWEKELKTKLVNKFVSSGDDMRTAMAKASSVIEGFGKTMAQLGTAGAKYVQTIGATVDMLNRQSTALNAVNDVMRKQVETTNAMIDAGAQFAKDMVTMFLPGGPIVKFIASAAIGIGTFLLKQKNELDNKLASSARDMAEKQYKIYSDLGQAGAMAVGGMDDVARLGAKFNLTTEQMGPLVNAIKDSGKELAQLGGSVSGGIKIMERLGSVTKDNEMQLRHMGISMEQVPEYASSYMKILRTTGVTQERATKLGSEAMMEYIRETNALTALTGATRREQEEAAEAIYQQKATAAALLLMPEEQRKSYQEFSKMMIGLDKGFAPVVQGLSALATGTLNSADSVKLMEQLEPALNAAGTSSQKFTEAIKNAKSDVERQKLGTELIAALNNPKIQEQILSTQAIGAEYGLNVAVTRAAQERKGIDIAKELQKIDQDRIDKEKGKDATTRAAAQSQKVLQEYNMEYAKFMQTQMAPALKEGTASITKFGSAAAAVADKLYKDFGIGTGAAEAAPETKETTAAAAAAYGKEVAAKQGVSDQEKKILDLQRQKLTADEAGKAQLDQQIKKEQDILEEKKKLQKQAVDAASATAAEAQQMAMKQRAFEVEKRALDAKIKKANDDTERWLKKGDERRAAQSLERAKELTSQLTGVEEKAKKQGLSLTPGAAAPGQPGAPAAAPGQPGAPGAAAPAAPAAPGTQQKMSQSDLAKMGLKLASKDVQAEGATVSSNLITLAQKVQAELPGFAGFTGLNDQFHIEKAASSQHTKGLAMDFVLAKPPTKEEGKQITDLLKSWGANYIQDEYNFPSSKATGGHIHAQVAAADGAILSGPSSGYQPNLTMHGTEAIIPLKNESVPVEITADSTVGQTLVSLNSVMQELLDSFRVSQDLLERIERSSSSTASASEKTARYAQN